jgi:MFS family permease
MSESAYLRRLSPGWALAVLTMISTCGFIDRIIMNVLAQPIKEEFGLTDTQVGLLAGLAFALLYATFGIPVGRLAERRRRLSLIGTGTILWSIATALCGLASSFVALALARVGVGIGEAVGLPATQSVISDYFPKHRRTTAMSVLLLAPPIGALIGSAAGATIAQIYGWQAAFLAAALPGFLLALLLVLTVAEPPRGQHDDLGTAADQVPEFGAVLRRMWQRQSLRQVLAGSTVASMAGFGLNAFVAALLYRRFGFSIAEAGITAGLISAVPGIVSVFGGGWLSDRLARRDARSYGLVPGVSLLLAAPIYAFAVTRDTAPAAVALLLVAGVVQYSYLGPSQGLLQNMMHPRMRASSYAVMGLVYALVGSGLGPVVVGMLSDSFGSDASAAESARGLTIAMALTPLFYVWAALHFLWSTRRLREELALPLHE